MPKKSKKFIEKKNSVTFHLVHRSQQDPLIADENAPQRVLVPITEKSKQDTKKRREEQQKFGVYFDDDYDYLQHLRDVNNTMEWEKVEATTPAKIEPKIKLPSSVFASEVEEEVGLLNKAAPQGLRLDVDPDIVAAMDDDFNYLDPENMLEDDFMELANAECSDDEYDEDEEESSDIDSNFDNDSEAMDEIGSLDGPQFTFKDEETKSRFTDYSMSSSVIRRNEQLTLLDDRFEKLYEGYDENEIGALDCDEIEGHVPENSDLLLQYAQEFEKQRRKEKLDKDDIMLRLKLKNCESDSDSQEELVALEVPEKEKWDCESILSTYSNIYNHPKLISEPSMQKIKVNKHGIPINVLGTNKLTSKALSQLDEEYNSKHSNNVKSVGANSIVSTLSTLSIRPKGESPEDRKERKSLLKEYRKERRLEKKANTEAFKAESIRQAKIAINNKKNVQGNKIL